MKSKEHPGDVTADDSCENWRADLRSAIERGIRCGDPELVALIAGSETARGLIRRTRIVPAARALLKRFAG